MNHLISPKALDFDIRNRAPGSIFSHLRVKDLYFLLNRDHTKSGQPEYVCSQPRNST